MRRSRFQHAEDGTLRVETTKRGHDVLDDPLLNKGTGFTAGERRALCIEGLLPNALFGIEQQVQRAYGNIARKDDALEKYIGMIALQDRSEALFFRVLLQHVEALMPIVYTPTVGDACTSFSQIFRRGRGIWISPPDSGRIDEVLGNADNGEIRLIVVTDGERILGLGDQGAGGMGIPIGKLALYTVAAGIHPRHCLPICLDVGTDNPGLRDDPLYVGLREPRLRGEPYAEFVDEFIRGVMRRFPRALLQWEDFKKTNALNLLERYRKTLASFNDDIQGTAAVGLAAVLAAGRANHTPIEKQRIVILGAGAAGVGIAHQVRDAVSRAGLTGDALIQSVAVLDSRGLLVPNREISDDYKLAFAWPIELAKANGLDPDGPLGLLDVVRGLKPTVLIGTSGQPGAFTEEIVRAMADGCDRPAIFPFSNPTSKCEATPNDIIHWTAGRAFVATGSPFAPVDFGGRTVRIGQSNNVYVFPGVGLGCLVAEVTEVTDSMFTLAAEAVAGAVEDRELEAGTLFPRLTELRSITHGIATAVVREANRLGLGRAIPDDEVEQAVSAMMWYPDHPVVVAV